MRSMDSSGLSYPVVEEALQVKQTLSMVKHSLFWCGVNAVLFAVVLYDVTYRCPYYSDLFYYFEIVLVIGLGLNMIIHLCRYVWNVNKMGVVIITPKQRELLNVQGSDPYFSSTPLMSPVQLSSCDNSNSTPFNLSASSWLNQSFVSLDGSTSPNYSTSTSWIYYNPNSPSVQRKSPVNAVQSPIGPSFSNIDNEDSLFRYLKEYETQENNVSVVGMSVEPPTNVLNSFWNHPTTQNTSEVSPLLRRSAYQLASPTIASLSTPGSKVDDSISPSSISLSSEIWLRIKIDPNNLTQWNANLRMWISKTILNRLVKEIEVIDDVLHRHGLADMRVGGVGLERLRKTAQVAQNIPSLSRLVPFLEVSTNQEYLISRIKELAKSGSMSEYRWNGGGSYLGKDWEEHLPTDSAIIMHLLATYFDSQLPPLAHNPEGRPFTSQYFFKAPDKPPKGKNLIAFYQSSINPPQYSIIIGDELLEVPKGRNNLFHTILLFLYQMYTKEHGMLGRVNLGPSGINILWVIDK